MNEAAFGRGPSCWVVDKHSLEEIQTSLVEAWNRFAQRLAGPLGEAVLVVWQLLYAWPHVVCWSAKSLEDLEDLIDFRVAGEQRVSHGHFGKDASDGPHVNGGAVVTRSKQNLGRTVPEGNHFVRVGAERDTESTSKTKIGELQVALFVDEKILRFEISVEDAMCVTVVEAANQLVGELADNLGAHTFTSTASRDRVHVFAKIEIEELEYKIELALLVNNVE